MQQYYDSYDPYFDPTPMRVPGSRRVEDTVVPLGNMNCHKHAVNLIDKVFSELLRKHELQNLNLPARPEKVRDQASAWVYNILKTLNRLLGTWR